MEPLENHDDKYLVFNRAQFMERMTGLPVHPLLDHIEIKDAVVIRRQDRFASSALAGYANAIALVISLTDDDKLRDELLHVSDYFQRQSELAAEEGWKTPDV